MKTKLNKFSEKYELKTFKEIFFNLANYVTLPIGLLLLYWGIFSNLIYPIMYMIKEPTVGVIAIGLLRIFILSAICSVSGMSFILMSFLKINNNQLKSNIMKNVSKKRLMDEVVKSLIPSTNCFTTCETEEELLSTTKCESLSGLESKLLSDNLSLVDKVRIVTIITNSENINVFDKMKNSDLFKPLFKISGYLCSMDLNTDEGGFSFLQTKKDKDDEYKTNRKFLYKELKKYFTTN